MKTFKQFISEQKKSEAPRGVIFDGNKVFVGKAHMEPLVLSDELVEKIKEIGDKYGYWYEGSGAGDVPTTTGFNNKSKYEGSWDNEFQKTVKGYPPEYLYTIFANTNVNHQRDNLLNPSISIFDSIMKSHKKFGYFKNREIDDSTLKKFLSMCSEKDVNFLKLSDLPATKKNVNMFLDKGESLSWPKNWKEYPNNAGKVAKKVEDARNTFLLNRKTGVYFAGSGHLIELLRLDDSLKMIGGEKAEK